MPWKDLTDQQRSFLTKFLKVNLLDRIKGPEKRASNIELTAEYEAFLRLEALYTETLATLPDDYPEKALIADTAASAFALRDAGKLEEAQQVLAPTIQEIAEAKAAAERSAALLLAEAGAPLPTDFVTPDQTDSLTALQAYAQTLVLPGMLPSKAELTALADAVKQLKELTALTIDDAAYRKPIWDELLQLDADTEADLIAESSVDVSGLSMAPNYADLIAAVQAAVDLSAEIEAARNTWDPNVHTAAIDNAKQWAMYPTAAQDEQAIAFAAVEALKAQRVQDNLAAFKLPAGSGAEAAAKAALEDLENILNAEPVTELAISDSVDALNLAADALTALYEQAPPCTAEELQAALDACNAARQKADALRGYDRLTKALTPGGDLSATSPIALDDTARTQFIAAMARAPVLAEYALEACKHSQHVGAVAGSLADLADLLDQSFSGTGGLRYDDPRNSESQTCRILEQGAVRGKAYLDGAVAYFQRGWPASDPRLEPNAATNEQAATQRGAVVAETILATGDPYDLDDPAVADIIGHLNYGASAQNYATIGHTAQVESTLAFLRTDAAKELVRTATAPTDNGAKLVVDLMKQVHGDSWTPPDPLTPELTKQALLVAMFNPVEQGSVGSCFATAGVITLREQDPERAMKIYKEAIEKGTFTPLRQRDDLRAPLPIPVVIEHTPGDNPITRAIEYSAATAGAALVHSFCATDRDAYIDAALSQDSVIDGLQDITGDSTFWLFDRLQLEGALSSATTFTYDPTAPHAKKSADGSSDHGCFVASIGGTVIHDADDAKGKEKFVNAAMAVFKKELAHHLTTPDAEAKLRAVVASDAFTNAFRNGEYALWQIPSGGFPEEVDRVLLDPDSRTEDVVPAEIDPSTLTESARTLDVVSGLMDLFDGKSGNVSLFTVGQHIFNGKPDDPSLAPILGRSKTEIDAHFQALGAEVTGKTLPKDQVARIFDAALAPALDEVPDDLKDAAKAELAKKRPTTDMKTPALNTAIAEGKTLLWTAVEAAITPAHVDAWATKMGGDMPGKPATEKKAAYVEALKKLPEEESVRAELAASVPMPAPIVLADTNWGDSRGHCSFVLAPDPATGELLMWERWDPPGRLKPAGRDWVDRNWTVTKPTPPAP